MALKRTEGKALRELRKWGVDRDIAKKSILYAREALDWYDAESAMFDLCEALYRYAADYHSGQWSALYTALSIPITIRGGIDEGSNVELIYQLFEAGKLGQK